MGNSVAHAGMIYAGKWLYRTWVLQNGVNEGEKQLSMAMHKEGLETLLNQSFASCL